MELEQKTVYRESRTLRGVTLLYLCDCYSRSLQDVFIVAGVANMHLVSQKAGTAAKCQLSLANFN